ncbi:MAG: NADP-dependent isocitrate dehydrogenase [Clostridia bacterium]|nr:NADP-dependent isocitrate dehydrogenase [Clostridia bacterium]
MAKITMKTPIVEMDGDEMTKVLWGWIKEILIEPFVELKTEYYDLSLPNRDKTDDDVTVKSALAAKKLGVAVKCATITPNAQRVEEYGLKKMWKSPNGTIRGILDGTVFRTPILVPGIKSYVPGWKKPITIARHAYGDIYSAAEDRVEAGESAYLLVCDGSGNELRRKPIHDFLTPGIIQGMHNVDASIESFARSCFTYALSENLPLWFGTKDTISKTYDHRFKDIFREVYESEFEAEFEKRGLEFLYTLVDDIVARVIRSEGGFVWACKNYDGDVLSDMVATAFGSLGMMSSVLVSPDGTYEYEAAHGTVTRHYYKYLKGEETSTNSMATIWAWTGALNMRGQKDGSPKLCAFAKKLENCAARTIEEGFMTGDLVPLFEREGVTPQKLESRKFLEKIAEKL